MPLTLHPKDIYEYFRLGLVTGLLAPADVVAWADRQILTTSHPTEQVIDLSLAVRLTYSQMVGLLNTFYRERRTHYPAVLGLLFAHAGLLLEHDPSCAPQLARELNLVCAEARLPEPVRPRLARLMAELDRASPHLEEDLASFLADYRAFTPQVLEIGCAVRP